MRAPVVAQSCVSVADCRLARFRFARGVRLALTDANPRSAWLSRLSLADYAGVSPDRVPPAHLTRYVDALHRRHARVIATGVRSTLA